MRRVGENMPRRVDVRIVAATNRRLEDEVGRRPVPRRPALPARRRPHRRCRRCASASADIPLLAAHFWSDAARARRIARDARRRTPSRALARYDWPGNVRELQNVMASLAVHAPSRGRVGAVAAAGRTSRAARRRTAARSRRRARSSSAGSSAPRWRRPAASARAAARALGVTRQGLAKMLRRLRGSTSRSGSRSVMSAGR